MPRVAIIGGGISGLATAHALLLHRSAFSASDPIDVTLFEASSDLGGNLRTRRRDGFVIDEGPDSWVAGKPHVNDLVRSLGLGDRLIETRPENRRVYVIAAADRWVDRTRARFSANRATVRLVPLPEGLLLGVPTSLWPLATTPLLSARGKLRAALDLVIPPGSGRTYAGDEDESVGAFVRRRLGSEALDQLAAPLLGGLFSGDVDELSLRASFPQLLAMERDGGMIRGARAILAARRTAAATQKPSAFLSLRGGVGELVDALGARIDDSIRLRARVVDVARPTQDSFRLAIEDPSGRTSLDFEHVVVAGAAHVAGRLVGGVDAEVSRMLDAIGYTSSCTVFLAFRSESVPRALDATGYLVPRSLGRRVLASTWISSKWEGRAPDGTELVRFFFAGDSVDLDDDGLIALARAEAREVLGIDVEPVLHHVGRFVRASPQPRVGHPSKMRAIAARIEAISGLHLVGSAYDGVGIGDCVRQAEAVAATIAGVGPASLSTRS